MLLELLTTLNDCDPFINRSVAPLILDRLVRDAYQLVARELLYNFDAYENFYLCSISQEIHPGKIVQCCSILPYYIHQRHLIGK